MRCFSVIKPHLASYPVDSMALGIGGVVVSSFLLFQTSSLPAPPAETPDTPPPLTCPAGTPIGPVNLEVRSLKNADPLPFENIIHLSEGDTVLYKPILRGNQKRIGEVALVLVPAKQSGEGQQLIVTDPKPAAKQQEWSIPQTITLAAFVYGPG